MATWRSSFSLISGGRSNLTYLVRGGGREWVLRRPPLGHVLPTAHDMAREYRVLAALADTDVPAPRPLALCEDAAVNEMPFYVMEYRPGIVLGARPASRLRRRRAGAAAHQRGAGRHAGAPARRSTTTPSASRASAIRTATSNARCGAGRSSGNARRPATLPEIDELAAACAPRCPLAAADDRARRLPARQPGARSATIRAASSPSSIGRWRRSAIRSPTSATR